MKELSIEEKAQRYDEALERAKGVIEQNPLMEYLKKGIEYILPELKESEDERIRKEIIDFIYDKTDTYELREKSNSWLTWLEKQGEFKSSTWTEGDVVRHGGILALVTNGRKAIKSNCEQITIQYPDEWVKAETKERKYFFEELGKQGEQKPFDYENANIQQNDFAPKSALEAAKEEKVDNANKVEPKFRIGDVIEAKPMKCHGKILIDKPNKIIDIIEESYILDNGKAYSIKLQDGWKLSEQKSIDKVEPKFYKGEWVVFNDKHGGVYQIEKIENFQYTLRHILGGSMPLSFSHEDMIRPWTISDAKDGDVLVCKDYGYNSYILFGEKNIHCWYNGQTEHFHPTTSCKLRKDATIYPATKEQRDLLFQKMREAGYEWDAKKKESKEKIEQKPSQWNISDYRTWQYIVSDVLTKHDGIGQYLDDGFCKRIAKYMQEEWGKRLTIK